MIDSSKHIDEKIKERALKRAEIEDLGEEIAQSAKPVVIAFIDLSDSTTMKFDRKPEEWLGSIYEFLTRVGGLVMENGGVVVKRIGDEIMATFKEVSESERFLFSVRNSTPLRGYKFKIAIDYGDAYHFKFIDGREDDPYGTTVDRCARIAKLGQAGTLLCSGFYRDQLTATAEYTYVGDFALKGLKDRCAIHYAAIHTIDSAKYLEPLLENVNQTRNSLDGFTRVGRILTSSDIREPLTGKARPYMARELLSLPRCPFAAQPFFAEREKAQSKDDFDTLYLGYVVEWELYFQHSRSEYGALSVSAGAHPKEYLKGSVFLDLPLFSLEVVKLLKPEQVVRVRGVIQYWYLNTVSLNYVELELVG